MFLLYKRVVTIMMLNQPSEEAMKRLYQLWMRTTVPRIIAAEKEKAAAGA